MKLQFGLILLAACLLGMARSECYKSEDSCNQVCDNDRRTRGNCEPCKVKKYQCLCTRNCYDTENDCLSNCQRCTGVPSQCTSGDSSSCSGATLYTCPTLPRCYQSEADCIKACGSVAGTNGGCDPTTEDSCYQCEDEDHH